MNNAPQSVLIVEDDPTTQSFLTRNLRADGYQVSTADSVRTASRMFEVKKPDIGLINLGLPDGSGLDVIAKVRRGNGEAASRINPTTPLVVLSAESEEIDRVRCFERGCDDFVAKPFSYTELRLRVRALLRRANAGTDSGALRIGDLELDPLSRDVRVSGTRVDLSQKEFALLRMLASEPTRVFTKAELLRDVWGYRSLGATRTLDSHICRLRHKLNGLHSGSQFIVTVWGVGYRMLESPRQRLFESPRQRLGHVPVKPEFEQRELFAESDDVAACSQGSTTPTRHLCLTS